MPMLMLMLLLHQLSLDVLVEVDDAVSAGGHEPRLTRVEGNAEHAQTAFDAVAFEHLERHDLRIHRRITAMPLPSSSSSSPSPP